MIKNPRTTEEMKDLHTYVTKEVYAKVDEMVEDGSIKTKTDYVADLIHKDLKEREGK